MTAWSAKVRASSICGKRFDAPADHVDRADHRALTQERHPKCGAPPAATDSDTRSNDPAYRLISLTGDGLGGGQDIAVDGDRRAHQAFLFAQTSCINMPAVSRYRRGRGVNRARAVGGS
jgi:hypothetical protein